jgi:hypothetical protein
MNIKRRARKSWPFFADAEHAVDDTLATVRVSPSSLVLKIKSWLQVQELDAIVQLTTQKSIEQSDTVGTLHFARWVNFNDHNQINFFSDFDGSLRKYIEDFSKYMGPTFDLFFKHVEDGPPLPVEKNVDAFYNWIVADNLPVTGFYSAYPTLSVQDIRTSAGVIKGAVNKGLSQSPIILLMPAKSPNHLAAATQLITQSWTKFREAADAMGTIHFARFLPFGTTNLGYISTHDGTFDNHVQDLSTHLGPMFDQLLENVVDSPPTPVQKNTTAFAKWIDSHNIKPWWFYSAYPNVSVRDIRSRIANVA